jgi:hypothetical protein
VWVLRTGILDRVVVMLIGMYEQYKQNVDSYICERSDVLWN